MAKLVKVRYGLANLSRKEYIYMVNDNVKRGSVLMPTVKHAKSGKIYTTMGVVQHSVNPKDMQKTYEELQEKGKLKENGAINIVKADKVTRQVSNSLVKRGADEHGFGFKRSIFTEQVGETKDGRPKYESAIGVGNEKYEARKTNDVVQNTRQDMVDNREITNSSNMSYNEFYDKYFKGE